MLFLNNTDLLYIYTFPHFVAAFRCNNYKCFIFTKWQHRGTKENGALFYCILLYGYWSICFRFCCRGLFRILNMNPQQQTGAGLFISPYLLIFFGLFYSILMRSYWYQGWFIERNIFFIFLFNLSFYLLL